MKGDRVFVSHAVADKALVDDFLDLLHTGLNLHPDDIFCTSLEGMGIPTGNNFIDFIKSKIQKPDIILMIVSQNYLSSHFCIQEVGATWALGLPFYPILVPPVDFSDMKAVLMGVQAIKINDKACLNELRDDLIEKLALRPLRTSHWENKRDKFLSRQLLTLGSRDPATNIAETGTPSVHDSVESDAKIKDELERFKSSFAEATHTWMLPQLLSDSEDLLIHVVGEQRFNALRREAEAVIAREEVLSARINAANFFSRERKELQYESGAVADDLKRRVASIQYRK